MGVTKSSVVVHNNITLTAGAGDTTSSNQALTSAYRTICHIQFTNGGTGPTVQAQTIVQVSEDGTNYYNLVTVYGGTVNSAVSYFPVELPDAVENVRFVSGSNTNQAVTLRVVLEEITGI